MEVIDLTKFSLEEQNHLSSANKWLKTHLNPDIQDYPDLQAASFEAFAVEVWKLPEDLRKKLFKQIFPNK